MKNFNASIAKIIFFILTVFGSATSLAQPTWSRGVVLINAGPDEAMQRVQQALTLEGYSNIINGGDYISGDKNYHHAAVITCSASPGGRTTVNIFVSSQFYDKVATGDERQRLQSQLEKNNGRGRPHNIIEATWLTQADTYRGKTGQRFKLNFPPGGHTSVRVWGTDVYSDDSYIGVAAVHAGLISFQHGGSVTIEIRDGQTGYTGTSRNGVISYSFGMWQGSFVFVR